MGNTVFYRYYSSGQMMDEVPLDMSMENPGIYFLKIKAEESTYLKKLFIP